MNAEAMYPILYGELVATGVADRYLLVYCWAILLWHRTFACVFFSESNFKKTYGGTALNINDVHNSDDTDITETV